MLTDEELAEIARRLYARRTEGVITRLAKAPPIENWRAREHECHWNVTNWCAFHPEHKPVRGWLYFPLLVQFNTHSVIENEDGELVDITPTRSSDQYPFIRAEEDEAGYIKIIEALNARGVEYLDYTP